MVLTKENITSTRNITIMPIQILEKLNKKNEKIFLLRICNNDHASLKHPFHFWCQNKYSVSIKFLIMLNSKHLLILEFVKVRNLRDSICVFQRYLLLKFMFLLAQINPFVPNTPYLYPLKTSENLTENIRKP